VTGVEGYVESAAIGLLAGRFAASEAKNETITPPPGVTALGALLQHITGNADHITFQPMNINFGLFPPMSAPEGLGKEALKAWQAQRKAHLSHRALMALDNWLGNTHSSLEFNNEKKILS